MQQETTDAFVLHSRPFKETSLILHCFTQNFGLISVVAKGIKRKNAQAKRAILQPFNLLKLEFTGRGELKTLCESELIRFANQPKGNALACCYYLNELTLRSLKEWQEHPELFNVYLELIQLFNTCNNEEMPRLLRNYELSLISLLGLSPDWNYDTNDDLIDENQFYEYVSETGFRRIELKEKNASQNNYSGKTLLAISNRDFLHINLKECQRITQKLIRPLIGNRPLESRKMWMPN